MNLGLLVAFTHCQTATKELNNIGKLTLQKKIDEKGINAIAD